MTQLRFNIVAALVSRHCSRLAAACPSCEGDKVEYKSAAKKLPPLEIPPDLTRPTADDRYAVPDINPKGQATYSAYSKDRAVHPTPPRRRYCRRQENARIERSGNQRWLVVKGEPDAVWNIVKEFWQETGFIVNARNPKPA